MLQMRLYGSWPAASSSGGDGAQGAFEVLDLRLERFLPVVVGRLPLALFAAQYREPQPRFTDRTLRGEKPLPLGGEGADPVHQRPRPLVGENGVEIPARVFFGVR